LRSEGGLGSVSGGRKRFTILKE